MWREVLKKALFVFLVVFAVVQFNEISNALAPNVFFVSNGKELISCVERCNDKDTVVLTNDVYLNSDLNIESSILLDLDGNDLYVIGDNTSIVIGGKTFNRKEIKTEIEPGYYEDKVEVSEQPERFVIDLFGNVMKVEKRKTTQIKRVWNPPVVEVDHEDSFKYRDDLVVTMKNGRIMHSDGSKGEAGVEDTWNDFNGKDGVTPKEPIEMLSGTLNLYNIAVYGGNGGKGGEGKYQSLLHIPFGGGKGGNGGNGAPGGNVISILREGCNVFTERTVLVPGKGGKGGELGLSNSNWWIYRGVTGEKGNDGLDGVILNLVLNNE